MQPDAGAAVRRLALFACSLLLSGCSYRCCRSPPGAATACSLNSLQSSAAVHPAVVVFPRPSWLSHVQAIVHLLVAAAVACSLRCLCMRPAAAPSAVVSAACRCCCCLRPGAASACSLLLLYAACLLQPVLLPLLAAWCCSACSLQLLCLQAVVAAAAPQPVVASACRLLLLQQSAAAVCTLLLPLPLAADVASA